MALVLLVGFVIIRTYLNVSQKELRAETSGPATLDANDALKATLDTLETSWDRVQSYSFTVGQDPLFLGRVIKGFAYAQGGYSETEESENLRLTATVVDSSPKAIIKYRGKSYVVQVGETIDGLYRVLSIAKRQVVLDRGGNRVILQNKPAEGTEGTESEPGYSNNGGSKTFDY
jgi:hypothetical protein